jgi:hypothetical protein
VVVPDGTHVSRVSLEHGLWRAKDPSGSATTEWTFGWKTGLGHWPFNIKPFLAGVAGIVVPRQFATGRSTIDPPVHGIVMPVIVCHVFLNPICTAGVALIPYAAWKKCERAAWNTSRHIDLRDRRSIPAGSTLTCSLSVPRM